MPDLLPDLIADILIRLPVKSLVRFRCISKPLCSQIDSPDFTKLHLNHSNPHPSIVIFHGGGCKLCSLNPHSRPRDHLIFHPFVTQHTIAGVIGSSNGLLCLFDSRDQVIIWNPAINKHLYLPPTPFTLHHFSRLVSYGFGYDSHHDDYKVLIIDVDLWSSDSNCRVFVYSMKSNLWIPISGWCFSYVLSGNACVYVSGALHFIADLDERSNLIIAVDLAAAGEEGCHYREVPRPREQSQLMNLGVLEGCLSCTCFLNGGSISVWVMKDYGVKKSWTKLISLHNYDLSSKEVFHFKPLATSNVGDEAIFEDHGRSLVRYDLKMKKLQRLSVPGSFDHAVYTESLANPMPTSSQDGC